jgi:hypothetical protein
MTEPSAALPFSTSSAYGRVAAGAVIHDHLLPEQLSQPRREQSCDCVGTARRRKSHQYSRFPGALRECRRTEAARIEHGDGRSRGHEMPTGQHGTPSLDVRSSLRPV